MTLPDVQTVVKKIDRPIFHTVGDVAASLSMPCYVVGGYVRDLFLDRHSKDVDFVTVGSGVELAEAVAHRLGKGAHLSVFRTYGTAQVKHRGDELEFVGARKESYRPESRNPRVEAGTLEEDIARRDFTINAMALSVTPDSFGELVDRFGGLADLEARIIRTPLDPDITFSDDPLRMMRAVRFATQLQFDIFPETLLAIRRNADRIKIITRERIADELNKIMLSPRPSIGWDLLLHTGLLHHIFPELEAMKGVQLVKGRGHKDNFYHTLEVLDNVAAAEGSLWLRWAALLHDIAKPVTKRWDDAIGWTFHNHNFIGARMVPRIFKRLKLPLDDKLRYVTRMVELHMRPIALVEDSVTDSAVRRLLVEAGEDIEDLMTLCRADITSKNPEKVRRHLENFDHVVARMKEIEEKDQLRAWRPPVDGHRIMELFGLPQSREVGEIKKYMEERLLDSDNPNDPDAAMALILEKAAEMGLKPVETV